MAGDLSQLHIIFIMLGDQEITHDEFELLEELGTAYIDKNNALSYDLDISAPNREVLIVHFPIENAAAIQNRPSRNLSRIPTRILKDKLQLIAPRMCKDPTEDNLQVKHSYFVMEVSR